MTKSLSLTVADGVHGVLRGLPEGQGLGGHPPVDGVGGAGQGSRAQGALVHPPERVQEPVRVAGELEGVGQHVLGKRHGLGVLHVGEAGHDGVAVVLGHLNQRHHQSVDRLGGLQGVVPQVHSEVGGDLVVPAPAGVQLASRGADGLGEAELDAGVHVLQRMVELEGALLDLYEDVLQSGDDLVRVLRGDDPTLLQHPHVGEGPHDVVERQVRVHVQGGGEGQGGVVHPGREPSGPQGLLQGDHIFLSAWLFAAVLPGSPQT